MANFLKHFAGLLLGIICGAVVPIVSLGLVNHKHLDLIFAGLNWQKATFIFDCVGTAMLLYIFYWLFAEKKESSWQSKALYPSISLYLCLYTTCAALCEKLNLSLINVPNPPMDKEISNSLYFGTDYSIVSSVGLVFVIAASMIEIYRCMRARIGDKTILCQPGWSYLVFMVGVSLLFSVWLPLLALPGAAVMLKWINKPAAPANIN